MRKNKLKLIDLRVNSFVTELNLNKLKTVIGGGLLSVDQKTCINCDTKVSVLAPGQCTAESGKLTCPQEVKSMEAECDKSISNTTGNRTK